MKTPGFKPQCGTKFDGGTLTGPALPGWPEHRAAAHAVHVDVEDELPALPAHVHHAAPAGLGHSPLAGDGGRHPGQLAHDGVVLGGELVEGGDVLARDHERVHRRLRIDVLEGHHVGVLVEQLRRDLLASDLAEQAVRHASPRSGAARGPWGPGKIPRTDQRRESSSRVTGPSFTSSTSMVARKTPWATGTPRVRRSDATSS